MADPLTPPPELIEQWVENWHSTPGLLDCRYEYIATQAAQWGADQELEACSALLELSDDNAREYLQSARRPKPPSLKEQALKMLRPLSNPVMPGTPEYRLYEPQAEIIRRALEALPDD